MHPAEIARNIAISTHAPLARCDVIRFCPTLCILFQLTHLLRGATNLRGGFLSLAVISTHAPLARCDNSMGRSIGMKEISTHAPLARCDTGADSGMSSTMISTHAPLARCDILLCFRKSAIQFQLTHLLRGATGAITLQGYPLFFISTHAPLARCEFSGLIFYKLFNISNSRTSCEVRLGK